MAKNTSQFILERLHDWGVRHVCVSPGRHEVRYKSVLAVGSVDPRDTCVRGRTSSAVGAWRPPDVAGLRASILPQRPLVAREFSLQKSL